VKLSFKAQSFLFKLSCDDDDNGPEIEFGFKKQVKFYSISDHDEKNLVNILDFS
jgi:hypothetical protein